MSTERDIAVDLSTPAICQFLKDHLNVGETYTDDIDQTVSEKRNSGYTFDGAHKRVIGSSAITMRTYVQRRCKVKTAAGRLVSTQEIVDPVDHPISLEIVALLFIKDQIVNQPIAAHIATAFDNADIINDDIDDVETEIVRAGANLSDYAVTLRFQLIRSGDRESSDINREAFEQQIGDLKDSAGNNLYLLEFEEARSECCEMPDRSFDDDYILEVNDVDAPEAEIAQSENQAHRECEGLELTEHRIGTAFQYYEWKVQWEVRPIRIGRCRIMKTKIPVFYSRIRKEALWCYCMTRHQIKANFEKAITSCLESAAVETGVLVIVTGGLGLAAAAHAFADAFFACFEKKIEDAVDCIFSSLKLVSEPGEWREKVF